MHPPKSYETERLILKPSSKEDASFFLKLLNTPKWLKNIGDRNVKSIEDAIKYIEDKILPQIEQLGYGNYIVIRKSDGIKLGNCGLFDREGLEGVDIGFAFLPEYEGQGYGFESAYKIKQLGFNDFGITKMSAITIKENIASQKLIEKLGFQFIKIINLPEDPEDLMLYELEKA